MKKLLKFHAEWCGPCKMMAPIVEEFKEKSGIEVESIDVDSQFELAQKYDVQSVPTLIRVDNGEETARIVGFSPYGKIEELME